MPPGTSMQPNSSFTTSMALNSSTFSGFEFEPRPGASTPAGRNGNVSPSSSMVEPMSAWSTSSLAMRRMVSAGTDVISSAHSGVMSAV